MKQMLYQDPLSHKYCEWHMMNWDIMEPIEHTYYLKDSIIGKD